MNMIQHQLSHLILYTLRRVAGNVPGSKYEERIENNTTIYGDIRDRLVQYFSKSEQQDLHDELLLN
jgi:hypothetical protein